MATGRFIVVGLIATGVYFGSTVALGSSRVGLSPVTANTIGFVISILVSYFGHHFYTFRVSGRHDFYFPRFLFVTLTLFGLSTVATKVLTETFGVSHVLVTAGIALAYPPSSYLLNFLWTFKSTEG